ncbi:MAG: molybdopterin-dependent oxidoreductase [Pseudomonadota bacterium]
MSRRTITTMCPMNCHPTLCGMKVTLEGDELVSIEGNEDHPDSQGFLCMRGNAAHEIVGNPARILHPLIRVARGRDEWHRASWEEAMDLIATRMDAAGAQRVGFWQGHGNAVNDYHIGLKRGLVERFANLWGAQTWNPAMICWGLGGFGFGITGILETTTKEDISACSDLVILWGANSASQANTTKHIAAARQRGARIVCIDVRRTEMMALAHEKILIRPGTDAALALAMMQVIIAEGLVDDAFIAAHTEGFDELAAHVADLTPDWAAAETGVAAEVIAALARDYATRKPGVIIAGGSSLHKGGNTWAAARAISCLPALVGNLGKPGTGFGPRHGARSHGAGVNDISAADRRPPGRYIPNQMEAIIAGLEDGAINLFLSFGSNVLSCFPDANRMRAALAKTDLVVLYDLFMSQSAREVADVILPSTIWLEELGAKATNTHVYLSDRALPIAGEARPLHRVMLDLGARLGVDDIYPWADEEAALNAVLDHPATGRVTVASLRENGGMAAFRISPHAYPTHEYPTPSGKVEFASDRAGAMGLPRLPTWVAAEGDYPLSLAQGRTWAHFHGFYDHARALPSLAAKEPQPQLWLSPGDASARRVGDGDPIRMFNERGTFTAAARVTRQMPDGAVWIHDGWPGLNALTDGAAVLPEAALDAFPFSVGQSNYGAWVEVARA